MAQQTKRQIKVVHQRLDAFELRVLECQAPTIDLTMIKNTVVSLRAEVDILKMRGPDPDCAPVELMEKQCLLHFSLPTL